jgi:hypothetical protein
MSATPLQLSTAVVGQRARFALLLAILGLPGSTIAWDLPAGGYWIGMPLALAAVVFGVRGLAETTARRAGRRMAVAAIVLATVEILFTAMWTVAG